jgi:hypothetical protein
LFEANADDPFIWVQSALLAGVLAGFACWFSTKQASAKDSIQALRNE